MSDRFFIPPEYLEQAHVVGFLLRLYGRPFVWFCGGSGWRGMVVS